MEQGCVPTIGREVLAFGTVLTGHLNAAFGPSPHGESAYAVFRWEAGMASQSDEIIAFREHVEALRNGCRDAAEHIANSRQAIEHSLALLRVAGKIKSERSPDVGAQLVESDRDDRSRP